MKPGRELDRAVAEAMGREVAERDGYLWVRHLDGPGWLMWNPSKNGVTARTTVLDWLREHRQVDFTIYPSGRTFIQLFSWLPVDGETLEHALCLAVVAVRDRA